MIDPDELNADTKSAVGDREDRDITGWFWVGRPLDALESVLAKRDAEVAAKAWDEGYWQGINGHTGPGNPYRDSGAAEKEITDD